MLYPTSPGGPGTSQMNTSEWLQSNTKTPQSGGEGCPHRADAFDATVSTKKRRQSTSNNPSNLQGNQAAHEAQILGGRQQLLDVGLKETTPD